MNQKVLELFGLMIQKPPNYQLLRYKLESQQWEQDELSELAGLLIEKAQYDFEDYYFVIVNEVDEPSHVIGNQAADYIYYQIKLLLEFGLNPNHYFQSEQFFCLPLKAAVYIDNPRECLRLAQLLLEHGANPNAKLSNDEETIFEGIDFDIWFYELSNGRYYLNFQLWLLMMSYGGTINGEVPVTFFDEHNDVSEFRDYERYTYQMDLSQGQRLNIVDKATGQTVAFAD